MRWILCILLLSLQVVAAPPVLVVSFDALAAHRFGPDTMPRLWALSRKGLHGRGLPPFPSTTFNGHATLATGCFPEHHGIVANSLVDPTRGYFGYSAVADLLEAEPLWVAATRSGLKAATVGWPCADAPWRGERIFRQVPFASPWSDAQARDSAREALQDGADLVMLYQSGIDTEAHLKGPASAEVREKLALIDREIADWLPRIQELRPGLQVWLLADHGTSSVPRRISLPNLLEGIPCRIIAHGGSATLHLERFSDLMPARERLRKAGLKAWTRSEIPESFHLKGSPRCGELVVLAPHGCWLAQNEGNEEAEREAQGRAGAHAFEPTHPDMATWLVVLGTGKSGELGTVQLRDVAPTLAHRLGIHWCAPRDGKPIPALR